MFLKITFGIDLTDEQLDQLLVAAGNDSSEAYYAYLDEAPQESKSLTLIKYVEDSDPELDSYSE